MEQNTNSIEVNNSFNPTNIGGFIFDAVLKEEHEQQVEITENPIEFGAPINDHMYLKARTINMEVAVSDNPMGDKYDNNFGEKNTNRNGTAYKKFIELAASGEPFDVQTQLLLYRHMQITSIGTVTDSPNYRGQSFTVQLKQLNLTNTEEVFYKKPKKTSGTTAKKSAAKTTLGKVQPQPVTDPVQNKNISVVKNIVEGKAGDAVKKVFSYVL